MNKLSHEQLVARTKGEYYYDMKKEVLEDIASINEMVGFEMIRVTSARNRIQNGTGTGTCLVTDVGYDRLDQNGDVVYHDSMRMYDNPYKSIIRSHLCIGVIPRHAKRLYSGFGDGSWRENEALIDAVMTAYKDGRF